MGSEIVLRTPRAPAASLNGRHCWSWSTESMR